MDRREFSDENESKYDFFSYSELHISEIAFEFRSVGMCIFKARAVLEETVPAEVTVRKVQLR